jgi:hypothetical protein
LSEPQARFRRIGMSCLLPWPHSSCSTACKVACAVRLSETQRALQAVVGDAGVRSREGRWHAAAAVPCVLCARLASASWRLARRRRSIPPCRGTGVGRPRQDPQATAWLQATCRLPLLHLSAVDADAAVLLLCAPAAGLLQPMRPVQQLTTLGRQSCAWSGSPLHHHHRCKHRPPAHKLSLSAATRPAVLRRHVGARHVCVREYAEARVIILGRSRARQGAPHARRVQRGKPDPLRPAVCWCRGCCPARRLTGA